MILINRHWWCVHISHHNSPFLPFNLPEFLRIFIWKVIKWYEMINKHLTLKEKTCSTLLLDDYLDHFNLEILHLNKYLVRICNAFSTYFWPYFTHFTKFMFQHGWLKCYLFADHYMENPIFSCGQQEIMSSKKKQEFYRKLKFLLLLLNSFGKINWAKEIKSIF